MPLIRQTRAHCARGYSMLEALLAVAVLSIGLLGAAALLLESLRTQANAQQRLGATQLARDMAERIRANPLARASYDTRSAAPFVAECAEPAGCDITDRALADRAHFQAAARALFAHREHSANVEFAPAIGPATPDRYVISLNWRDSRDVTEESDTVTLQVLAQSPVAG